jgi:type I restriction enzyme S subunit
MNQIKQGYKQTKVGIIPVDWNVVKIKEVAKVKDGTHFSPKSTCGEFKYITSKNIKFGYLDLSDISYVSEEEHKVIYKSCPVKNGDLLLTKDGANTGNACINTLNEEFSLLSSVAFIDGFENTLFNQFLLQQILWNKTQKRLQAEMSGQAITRLTITKIDSFNIILPPLKEQEKIAEILTTWDEAITKQQELIKTKELQKKALMQKLLSGKVRFSEFTDEWKNIQVNDFMVERNIQSPKNQEYPLMAFVAYKGVTDKGDRYNREFLVTDEDNKKYKQTEYGDFIYSSNNLETGSIGLNRYGSATISPVYSIFRITEDCNFEFISNLLITKEFINKMVRYRQGVVYGQWRIHESDFLKIKVNIPCLEEQDKIAEVLSFSDNEIDLLKKELEELKLQKKALMQKLLTGQVRVKV